ncbi:MAG TPA: hypothetical protein VNW92_15670 [Polyangiaceae bacterium]|jgi:hypothetical protein|nr:hypothetical protein [Polyangiaceae bacterium]
MNRAHPPLIRFIRACVLLSALSASACAKKGIVSFAVTPPLACPGQGVVVQWEVRGKASLHAEPAPAAWADGATDSAGKRSVPLNGATTFTLSALDANPADGNSFATQSVKIVPQNDAREASAACDPNTLKCTGSFVLKTDGAIRVARISNPTLVRSGAAQPRDLCVTPPNGKTACVKAGASIELHSPAAGSWTVEASLLPDEPATPPARLRLDFDFGCPAPA